MSLSVILTIYSATTTEAGKRNKEIKSPPKHGWCKGGHSKKNPRPAQSGYGGYCKACYGMVFPERHHEKLLRRISKHKPYGYCAESKELLPCGYCKPCFNARGCETCGQINTNLIAHVCTACHDARQQLGATTARLSLWCATCCSEAELSSSLCRPYYTEFLRGLEQQCHHCGCNGEQEILKSICNQPECRRHFVQCQACLPLSFSTVPLVCKRCWHASGDLCIF